MTISFYLFTLFFMGVKWGTYTMRLFLLLLLYCLSYIWNVWGRHENVCTYDLKTAINVKESRICMISNICSTVFLFSSNDLVSSFRNSSWKTLTPNKGWSSIFCRYHRTRLTRNIVQTMHIWNVTSDWSYSN